MVLGNVKSAKQEYAMDGQKRCTAVCPDKNI